MIGGIVTLVFVGLLMLAGKLMWSAEDWGKPVKRPHKPIGKVDMQAYRDFHARHGGPATVCPPVPRN